MQSESQLKTELVSVARKFGDYAKRIEDQYQVGMPDIIYGVGGGPTCLIEAKRVFGNEKFGPTPRQWVELERFDGEGDAERKGLLLGFHDSGVFLLCDYEPTKAGVHRSDCLESDPGEPFPLFIRRFLR